MLQKLVKAAPFWIVEFAVFFGLYLLFASSLDAMERLFGLVIAALAVEWKSSAHNSLSFAPV